MSGFEFTYLLDGKEYRVIVTRKKMKTIRYKYKDGIFKISAPRLFVTQKQIIDGLNKYSRQLVKMDVRSSASGDDYIYILGIKVNINPSGEINFTNGDKIVYKDRADLDKKLKKWFLKYITPRNRYYEQVMKIKKPYTVHVKKMISRYGSNSKGTHSLSYSTVLLHYTPDVIDSVIIHELAHEFERNHSQKFYDVVYKYCQNYKVLHNRLKKGIFHA